MSLAALSVVLLIVGGVGMLARSLTFVRVTIPENYGSNPGFGAYEVMVLPWWAVASVGVGLRTSVLTGGIAFAVGLFGLGLVAQLLGRVFGRSG